MERNVGDPEEISKCPLCKRETENTHPFLRKLCRTRKHKKRGTNMESGHGEKGVCEKVAVF